MKSSIFSITNLLELQNKPTDSKQRMLSTLAFDWFYVALSLLVTIGLMMDIWSHTEFGPDQSLFNEYHLLFYGSVSAITVMLIGFSLLNWRQGVSLKHALPQGYGGGLFAALFFGAAGTIDLIGHSLFGFESGIEALTSPTHLFLFAGWFLILFAPIRAIRARNIANTQQSSLKKMFPSLLSYGAMLCCISMPLMNLLPMGFVPFMITELRPADNDLGILLGIGGTILQSMLTVAFILWVTREFRLPKGSFTIIFGFYGLFLTILSPGLLPWAMFGLFGITLDIFYTIVKPDGTQRIRFLLFSLYASGVMWAICYITMGLIFGFQSIYYTGYNLYGSIGQGMAASLLVGYLMSMPASQPIMTEEVV